MTLEDLYYISQIIAVIAIIGSLVAIYFQQSQTNKIARAQISKDITANYSDTLREIMDPGLALIFRKVMFDRAPLSPVESTQILVYFNLTIAALRDGFHAERDGLIDARLMKALLHNICWYLTAPLFASEWRRTQRIGIYGSEFCAYVDAHFAKIYPNHEASKGLQGAHHHDTGIIEPESRT
jgi:hypothetical protein